MSNQDLLPQWWVDEEEEEQRDALGIQPAVATSQGPAPAPDAAAPVTLAPVDRQDSLLPPWDSNREAETDRVRKTILPYTKLVQTVLQTSPNPAEDLDKIVSAAFLSDALGIPFPETFDHHDAIAQEYWGRTMPAKNARTAISDAWKTADLQSQVGMLSSRQMLGDDSPEIEAQIQALEAKIPDVDTQRRSLPIQAFKAAASMLPFMLNNWKWAAPRAAVGAAAVTGVVALSGAEVALPAVFGAWFIRGLAMGSAGYSFQVEGGLQYRALIQAGVSKEIARTVSVPVGAVNAALEMVELYNIPGVRQVLQAARGRIARELGQEVVVKGLMAKLAQRATTPLARGVVAGGSAYVAGMATEPLTEMAQEAVNIVADALGASWMNQTQGSDISIATREEVAERLKETYLQTALAMLVVGAPGAFGTTLATARKPLTVEQQAIIDREMAGAQPQAPSDRPSLPTVQRPDESGIPTAPDITALPASERAAAADTYVTALQTRRDEIAKAFEADPVANVAALIRVETAIEAAQAERETIAAAPEEAPAAAPAPSAPWQQTRAEYETQRVAAQQELGAAPGPAVGSPIVLTPEEQTRIAPIRDQIAQAFTGFTPEQVDVAALYTSERARHFGQTIDEYAPAFRAVDPAVDPQFAGKRGGFTPGNLQASVQAVISATESADVSTYVHEIAHSEWGLMEDADHQVVREYALGLGDAHPNNAAFTAGEMDEDTYVQEAYTAAVEKYLSGEAAPAGRFGEIVKRIGEWIRAVYERVTSRLPELTPEMRELLDRHFGVDTTAQVRTDAGGPTVFQQQRQAVIQIGDVTLTRDQLGRIDPRLPDIMESSVRGNNKDQLVAALKDMEMDLFAANEEQRRQALVAITQNVEATDVADMSARTSGPGTLFQPGEVSEHEAEVQTAVERGEWVPERVLEEYKDREWAAQEIAYRSNLRDQARIDMESGQVTDGEDWIAMQEAMDLEPRAAGYYKNLWEQMEQGGEAADRETANRRFLASLDTREAFGNLLGRILDAEADTPILGTKSVHALLESALQAVAKKGEISEAHYRKLMDQVRDKPVVYRQLFAELLRDEGQAQQLAREAEADPGADELTTLRAKNRELRKSNKGLGKKIDSILKQLEGARRSIAFAEVDAERGQAAAADARETTREVVATVKETAKRVGKEARQVLRGRAAQQRETTKALMEQIRLEQTEKEQIIREAEKALVVAEREGRGAEAQARREERDKARGELKALREKDTARRKEAVERERERMRKFRELLEAKRYIDHLVRSALRPPASSIDYAYAKQIVQIQETVSLRASSAAEKIRRRLDAWYKAHPNQTVSEEAAAIIRQRPVRELTLTELEDIAGRVEALRQEGRQVREKKIAAERHLVSTATGTIFTHVTGGKWEPVTGKGSREAEKVFKGSVKNRIAANTLSMQRLAQILGPEGEKWLTREVNTVVDQELRAVDAIADPAKAKMKELGITPQILAKTETIDDRTYTHDEIIHMQIALRNEDSASTLRGGNRLTDAQLDPFIATLTPAEVQWGNYMMAQFGGENWTTLQQAYIEDTNRASKKVDNYFGMRIKDETGGTIKAEIASDILSRSGARPSYAPKKFMIKRIKIREEHRREMRLGATAQFFADIEKQQHYVATWQLAKRLQRIFNDRALREGIAQKFGRDWNQAIEVYINEVANPGVYKVLEPGSKFLSTLRANTVVGALAFNITTLLNQLTGPVLYLADAGPVHMMSALGQWITNPGALYRFVTERDPQVKHANLEGVRDQLRRLDGSAYSKFVKIIAEIGLKPLELIDTWTRVVGWKAVYDKNVGKVGEAEAIRLAQESTLRTQPSGRGKDLPLIYHNNAAKMFLMFSRQLNQIWNMVTWDMPTRARQGMVLEALADAFALGLTGLMIGMISRKRPPEEPEEWIEDLAGQFIAGIPFIGGDIVSGLAGDWWAGKGVNLLPAAAEGAGAVRRLFDGDIPAEDKWNALINVMPGIARSIGLPGVAMNRILRTARTGDPWDLMGGREE